MKKFDLGTDDGMRQFIILDDNGDVVAFQNEQDVGQALEDCKLERDLHAEYGDRSHLGRHIGEIVGPFLDLMLRENWEPNKVKQFLEDNPAFKTHSGKQKYTQGVKLIIE